MRTFERLYVGGNKYKRSPRTKTTLLSLPPTTSLGHVPFLGESLVRRDGRCALFSIRNFAMRITIIVILLFVALGVLAYSLMPDDTASESSQAMRLHSEATSTVEIPQRLDEIASALQRYQQLDQDQWNRAQSQQARLQKMLTDFDRRLRTIEAADAARTSDTAISGVAQSGGNTDVVSIDADTVDSEAVSGARPGSSDGRVAARWIFEAGLDGADDRASS